LSSHQLAAYVNSATGGQAVAHLFGALPCLGPGVALANVRQNVSVHFDFEFELLPDQLGGILVGVFNS
jgi:hypothetical protein